MAETSSAQRKLTRGIEQVQTLRREASAFEDRDAYVFRAEEQSRSTEEIRYRCYATEREAPPDHWPLLAGEAIQNLRSALDHAVWAASKRRGRNTGFPIFTDECEFKVLGRRMIQGVPEAKRAFIEEAQPYRVLEDAPTLDSLEWLRSLSNIDKHRALNAVVGVVSIEFAGVIGFAKVHWEQNAVHRVLGHGETHVSTLVARLTGPEAKLEDVDVNPGFAYQVRIEGRPVENLVPVARRVFKVISEIETGQALPPFSTYPI